MALSSIQGFAFLQIKQVCGEENEVSSGQLAECRIVPVIACRQLSAPIPAQSNFIASGEAVNHLKAFISSRRPLNLSSLSSLSAAFLSTGVLEAMTAR